MSPETTSLLIYSPLSVRTGAGGDRWLTEIAPRLAARSILPTVLAGNFIPLGHRSNPSTWYHDRIVSQGIPYSEFDCCPLSESMNVPLLNTESLARIAGEMRRHEVTYFLNAFFLQDIGVLLAEIAAHHRPLISAQHASLFQTGFLHNLYVKSISRNVLKAFDAFHVLNEEDYETYKSWGLENVYLIPNGVDTNRFRPFPGDHSSEFTVLFVGRLEYQKGVDVLLEALRWLERNNPRVARRIIVKICGTGPLKEMVSSFAEQRTNVHYLGYVPEEDLLILYRRAHLLTMPSRREVFGLVGLEAMASGLPVLSSNVSGPRSFVNKEVGLLVHPSDAAALAHGIERFYLLWESDSEEFARIGESARRLCIDRYSWDTVADKLADMIRKTLIREQRKTFRS